MPRRITMAYRVRLARAVTECARLAKANIHRYSSINIDKLFEPVLHRAGIRETPLACTIEVFEAELDRVFPRRKRTHRWLSIAMGGDANSPPSRRVPRRWRSVLQPHHR